MGEVKQNKTICIDRDIVGIVDGINKQGGKLSPVVCNLLRFYRDNDYRIPMVGINEDEDLDEIRRDQGLDDDESVLN